MFFIKSKFKIFSCLFSFPYLGRIRTNVSIWDGTIHKLRGHFFGNLKNQKHTVKCTQTQLSFFLEMGHEKNAKLCLTTFLPSSVLDFKFDRWPLTIALPSSMRRCKNLIRILFNLLYLQLLRGKTTFSSALFLLTYGFNGFVCGI